MQERDLKLLLDNKVALVAVAQERPTGDGFDLVVNGQPLQSARRDARRFASLDTVAALLRDLGVTRFQVQLAATGATVTRPSQ
jgi:hypothetical protein